MTFQAAVQAGSSELGDAVAQASEDVVERQQGARRNSTTMASPTMASSTTVRTVLCGERGPIGASSVVVGTRHSVTVLRLSP